MFSNQLTGKVTEKVTTIAVKCKNAVVGMRIPDRTKIFLSAMWFWMYVMFYFTKVFNLVLGFCLVHTPDSLIIFNPFNIKYTNFSGKNTKENAAETINKPTVVDARMKTKDELHENITNKLRAVISSNWDTDVGNDNCPFDDSDNKDLFGGVNVGDIVSVYPTLSTAIVWITYLFETDKKLNALSDEELGKKIKYMLINFGDKSIHRTSDLQKVEKIVSGEIPF
jgi:hypothetical protein